VKQIRTFSDQRLEINCSYCGEKPDTRDHVPSRILLDEPFPENLPVVPCCSKCNEDFSLDEEYFACALECALRGTTEIEKLKREKVKSILLNKTPLRQRIENSFIIKNGEKLLQIEEDRIRKVIIKLAKGHAKYENSEPRIENPTKIWMKPIIVMEQSEIDEFFAILSHNILPEVGSRALQRLFIDVDSNVVSNWIVVQEGNYQYSVIPNIGLFSVKMLIWDYLAVEVTWEERD